MIPMKNSRKIYSRVLSSQTENEQNLHRHNTKAVLYGVEIRKSIASGRCLLADAIQR